MLLTELPKEQQDIASNIVHNHMRRSTSDSEPGSPMDHGKIHTPHVHNLNNEDILRSIQQTTSEIQNYSYEALGTYNFIDFMNCK